MTHIYSVSIYYFHQCFFCHQYCNFLSLIPSRIVYVFSKYIFMFLNHSFLKNIYSIVSESINHISSFFIYGIFFILNNSLEPKYSIFNIFVFFSFFWVIKNYSFLFQCTITSPIFCRNDMCFFLCICLYQNHENHTKYNFFNNCM